MDEALTIISELRKLGKPTSLKEMAKFGINTDKALGVSISDLRKMAQRVGQNHKLANDLWNSGFHEARILAGMIDEPERVTRSQMDLWAAEFNSWDLCDQVCNNLFVYSVHAYDKAIEWSKKSNEFIKRAGFVLMAVISVHHKELPDKMFTPFFNRIKGESIDDRNYVKKAVNWALRQIGKRNTRLNQQAIKVAQSILSFEQKSARWIAHNALNELTNNKIQGRLKK